jgi:hypothetical protein
MSMEANTGGMERGELIAEAQAQLAAACVRLEYHRGQAKPWDGQVPEGLAQRLELAQVDHDAALATWQRLSAEV